DSSMTRVPYEDRSGSLHASADAAASLAGAAGVIASTVPSSGSRVTFSSASESARAGAWSARAPATASTTGRSCMTPPFNLERERRRRHEPTKRLAGIHWIGLREWLQG